MNNRPVRTQFRIDSELYEKVRELAHQLRISRNKAFGMIAERGLADYEQEQTTKGEK